MFNIAKGRIVEFFNRVDTSDPTNAVLVIVALKTTGLEADATLADYDTLAAILAAANDEATNTGYARKVLTDADITMPAPDDTNNWFALDIADQTWTSVQTTGGAWSKLLICYDSDSTAGTDTNIVPVTYHDFVVTPDGSNITAQVSANGFFRAA